MECFKILGSLLVVLSGFFLGRAFNRSAVLALSQSEAWWRLLCETRLQIDCFSLPVSDILARADPSLLNDCGYLGAEEERPKNFEALVASCSISDTVCRDLVQKFAAEFGKGYREEQLRECDYYMALLDKHREELASRLHGKKKTNSILCISGALGLVILFF